MGYAIQWVRSFLFTVQMYVMMALMGIGCAPIVMVNRKFGYRVVRGYSKWVMWTAGWMVGLKTEVRGTVPGREILVGAKHQSFLDILMITSVTPKPKFIMKASLRWAPVLGWYGKWLACIPVNRGRRAEAIKSMMEQVKSGKMPGGQLIIYPQGTRVAPGAKVPYKVGIGVIYEEMGQDCLPVACNVGVFWPRIGIYKKPGTAIVEFLPIISAGMKRDEFLKTLEERVEKRSNELMLDAGFNPN